jgi:RHS repeat-associated protein
MFQGKERNGDLDYYGARYYDPTIGRFISADTMASRTFAGMKKAVPGSSWSSV